MSSLTISVSPFSLSHATITNNPQISVIYNNKNLFLIHVTHWICVSCSSALYIFLFSDPSWRCSSIQDHIILVAEEKLKGVSSSIQWSLSLCSERAHGQIHSYSLDKRNPMVKPDDNRFNVDGLPEEGPADDKALGRKCTLSCR